MKVFGLILIAFGVFGILGTQMLAGAVNWYGAGEYVYPGFYGYSMTIDILFVVIGAIVYLKAHKEEK